MLFEVTTSLPSEVAKLKGALVGAPLELSILFGSGARNQLRRDSDLDVGIIPTSDFSLRDELDLAAMLSRAAGRDVDVVRLDQASVLVRWEAAKAHVLLFARTSSALPRFLANAALEHADLAPLLADATKRLCRRLAAAARP